jgi:hypothetical protein
VRALLIALAVAAAPAAQAAERWKPLFNGRNLDGWIAKINHRPLGENWRNTFRVRDGLLVVSYDQYERFSDQFGHLHYRTPFSSYRLRLEYRFVGPQAPGAPAWALRNSGVMLHGQAPQTLTLDQSFPISIEAQFLGGAPGETRPTANVCTPGTTVSIGGQAMREHCRNSTARTFPEGEWVRFEAEVRGSRLVRHIVNGEVVFEYADVRTAPAEYKGLNAAVSDAPPAPLSRGWISLQSEGHPIEFRRIEILELKD